MQDSKGRHVKEQEMVCLLSFVSNVGQLGPNQTPGIWHGTLYIYRGFKVPLQCGIKKTQIPWQNIYVK